jgi:tripartite-type tricarboxylate transporter receptor subunit TctC
MKKKWNITAKRHIESIMTKTSLILLLFLCLAVLPAGSLRAAEWPTKPLTLIVPWEPGGMTDISSRMLVEKFKDKLGQPVMVTNQGGAGGITGMRAVLASASNGYTFGSGAISSAFSAPFLLKAKPFDLDKVGYIGGFSFQARTVFTSPGKPYKTWAEFVEYARKNPGKISAGSGGSQIGLDGFKSAAKKEGLKLNFVMFKSGGEASTALMGGHVDVCEVGSGTPAYQAGRQGKLVPLLGLSQTPDVHFPKLTGVSDLGYPFAVTSVYGMVLPMGVPEPIRAKFEKALKDTLQEKSIQENMANMGLDGRFIPGKDFEVTVKKIVADVPKLSEYVKDVD